MGPYSNIPGVYQLSSLSLPTGVSTLPQAPIEEIDLGNTSSRASSSNDHGTGIMTSNGPTGPGNHLSAGLINPHLIQNAALGTTPPPNYFDTVADMYARLTSGSSNIPAPYTSANDVYGAGFRDEKGFGEDIKSM